MPENIGACCLCDGSYFDHGHNPFPLAMYPKRCCSDCNAEKVIPARIELLHKNLETEDTND